MLNKIIHNGRLKATLKRLYQCIFLRGKSYDPYKFGFTVTNILLTRGTLKRLLKIKGRLLSNDILKYKTADTIFILGSGPSINDITQKQWEHICQCDSMGFNYWLAHDFVPTYYILQNISNINEDQRMLKLLQDKLDLYKNVPFIIRGNRLIQPDLDPSFLGLFRNDQVYYVNEIPIHSECEVDPAQLIKFFELLKLFGRNKIKPGIPKLYASIPMIMNLCYIMGYKKIVLCGIDMKTPGHFWDAEKYKTVRERYALEKKNESKIMMLNDRGAKKYTVSDAIRAQKEYYQARGAVQVYIANKNTALYPHIELYFTP